MKLFAAVNNFLMDIPVDKMRDFEKDFLDYMDTHKREVEQAINEKKELTDDIKKALSEAIDEFKKVFLQEV
jgi:F-type H+-transporting ATPase subunit alpha